MLSLQKKFGRKPKSDNQGATRGTLLPPPSSPPATQPAAIVGADVTKKGTLFINASKAKPRPPPKARKGPIPRLPDGEYKIVYRPRCPVKLTDFGVAQILHAVCTVQKIAEPVAIENDHLRIHPENNTFTISTPDEARARTYAALKSLSVGENTYEMNAGIVFNAYSYETDAEIFDEFRKRNPNLNVVGGRRLGKSRHMIVTIAERELPRWIRYLVSDLRLFPFHDRVEACYNCRKTGHRTDVCPLPRRNLCRRCGGEHPPMPEEAQPTCTPKCIICTAGHNTGNRNCKYRFIKRKYGSSFDKEEKQGTDGRTRDRGRSRPRDNHQRENGYRSRSSSFPPMVEDHGRSSAGTGDPWRKRSSSRGGTHRSDASRPRLRYTTRKRKKSSEKLVADSPAVALKAIETAAPTMGTQGGATGRTKNAMDTETVNTLKRQAPPENKEEVERSEPKRRQVPLEEGRPTLTARSELLTQLKERMDAQDVRITALETKMEHLFVYMNGKFDELTQLICQRLEIQDGAQQSTRKTN
ncbi:hypothetical protein HPB47_004073 [Ixodes persulcatus]|uniref:Uncharacterized protein n=1 Tax=Ixodes persulcatus TaxID=34615 RepID=A0AC60PH88_IXOPE|nr:hypothetical protein HPB47_004073 [Ixodes persulcatus]